MRRASEESANAGKALDMALSDFVTSCMDLPWGLVDLGTWGLEDGNKALTPTLIRTFMLGYMGR